MAGLLEGGISKVAHLLSLAMFPRSCASLWLIPALASGGHSLTLKHPSWRVPSPEILKERGDEVFDPLQPPPQPPPQCSQVFVGSPRGRAFYFCLPLPPTCQEIY